MIYLFICLYQNCTCRAIKYGQSWYRKSSCFLPCIPIF